ncbi:hypothetical protein KHQ89_05940 [Mycoplasmatota bacterium]|nr:hypothetical protein KHQ89_05940 [Mycoplasmatota bacterium]
MKKIVSYTLLIALALILVSCGTDESTDPSEPIIPTQPIIKTSDDFNYYEQTKLNAENKIYVFNTLDVEELDNDQAFTAQAIQGLFARDEVTFFFDGRSITNMTNTDRYYLDYTTEKYGLEVEDITLAQGVQMYIDSFNTYVEDGTWGSQIPLTDFNNIPGINAYTEEGTDGYLTPGYIVYRKGTISVNVAATLASITGFIPVELSQVETYNALGLVEKMNVDNIVFDYRWVFENTLSELNPEGLIHQDYSSPGGETNEFLKDYGITERYMYVYYDSQVNAPESFKTTLHQFLSPNRPILGYAYQEDQDVEFFSQYGQFIVPTDYTYNLSYLLAEEFRNDIDGNLLEFEQPNDNTVETADPNKHYVSFVVSDGDNATMWQNTSPFAQNFMNAVGRENDDFPVTWSMTPSLADLMPTVLDSVYNEVSNENDSFVAPVSGQGYINAGSFMKANDGEYFADYLSKLDNYMEKADLNVVTVIGADSSVDQIQTLESYAQVDAVTGGIVYSGSKYFGNVKGGVYWANGKPFVGPRDSLWETTPEFIAARINMYENDNTSIDGYSIINVHPWSHSYEDIRTIVNMLNDNVEVVSVDNLIDLMTENIVDKTNDGGFTIPELNGISITQAQLESNPSLIPVNPLFNDFILWEEDWTATSGSISYSNSDAANSNVGSFSTSIQITNGSVATKNQFTFPNIDDLWISFVARADSTNPLDTSTFKVTMNIDGQTTTIVDNVEFKGVSGTGSASSLNGDGWQYIAFPITQFESDYKNKDVIFSIEVLDGVSLKVDRFEISQKLPSSTSIIDPYNNQFLNGDTEDWILGHIFMTSQYYYWGALNKDTGKPFTQGAIQIDTSDGGGDEKRNANTNLWMAKTYVLPESDDITISYDINGGSDGGSSYKVSLYIDGEYIVLTDWLRAYGDMEEQIHNITSLYPDIDFNGKTVTVLIEVRDSGINNGVGETVQLESFTTTSE